MCKRSASAMEEFNMGNYLLTQYHEHNIEIRENGVPCEEPYISNTLSAACIEVQQVAKRAKGRSKRPIFYEDLINQYTEKIKLEENEIHDLTMYLQTIYNKYSHISPEFIKIAEYMGVSIPKTTTNIEYFVNLLGTNFVSINKNDQSVRIVPFIDFYSNYQYICRVKTTANILYNDMFEFFDNNHSDEWSAYIPEKWKHIIKQDVSKMLFKQDLNIVYNNTRHITNLKKNIIKSRKKINEWKDKLLSAQVSYICINNATSSTQQVGGSTQQAMLPNIIPMIEDSINMIDKVPDHDKANQIQKAQSYIDNYRRYISDPNKLNDMQTKLYKEKFINVDLQKCKDKTEKTARIKKEIINITGSCPKGVRSYDAALSVYKSLSM